MKLAQFDNCIYHAGHCGLPVGVTNGALQRGTFAHQQIVAVCRGVFLAKLTESLFQLFRKREN